MARTRKQQDDRFGLFWTLLRWERELRNARLQQLLGLASVQVSRLISEFRAVFPGAISNDAGGKRWKLSRPTETRRGQGIEGYLSLLRNADDGLRTWFEDGRISFQEPDEGRFAILRAACVEQRGVEIDYASMEHPAGIRRVIFPHSIVRLAQRWHVRAWCTVREGYRDFNLGRMKTLSCVEVAPKLPPDVDWQHHVDVRVGAHHLLSRAQEEPIRREFFGAAAARRFRVRAAMVNYVINDMRAAVDPERQRPPEFLLEVLNRDELRDYLFERR
jgi:hypothetical protein